MQINELIPKYGGKKIILRDEAMIREEKVPCRIAYISKPKASMKHRKPVKPHREQRNNQ